MKFHAHICSLSTSDLTRNRDVGDAVAAPVTPRRGFAPSRVCNCLSSLIYKRESECETLGTDGTYRKIYGPVTGRPDYFPSVFREIYDNREVEERNKVLTLPRAEDGEY